MSIRKKCPKCGMTKEITEFSWANKAKGYHVARCKTCTCAYVKQYHTKNKDKVIDYQKRYYAEHRVEVLDRNKRWVTTNFSKAQTYKREWALENKERVSDNQRRWKLAHREELNKKACLYRRTRCAVDINFKILCNLRRRFNRIVLGTVKKGSAVRDLGCSVPELKQYLESKFQPGMSWDNYGKEWHIDHIIPLSFFDLQNETELKMAVRYQNLQPLWAKENIAKGNKINV